MKDTTSRIVAVMETSRQAPLSEEELNQIELWEKGRALAQLTSMYGFEVMKEMLQSYVTDQVEQLLETDPGDKDEVIAIHAVAFAANRVYNKFIQDIDNAVRASSETPECIKASARKIKTAVPLEQM